MAAKSLQLEPLRRRKIGAQILTRLLLVFQGVRDVEDCDPGQTHLA
jgi:hypothetical protein